MCAENRLNQRMDGLRLQTPESEAGDRRTHDQSNCRNLPGGKPRGRRSDLSLAADRRLARRISQLEAGITDVAQAIHGLLHEAAAHEPHQRRWRVGRQQIEIGLVLEHRGQHHRHLVAAEEAGARQSFVEADAERPDIGALVDLLSRCLLWAHVGGRAENLAPLRSGKSQRRRCRELRVAARLRLGSQRLGEPKVEDLDGAAGCGHRGATR